MWWSLTDKKTKVSVIYTTQYFADKNSNFIIDFGASNTWQHLNEWASYNTRLKHKMWDCYKALIIKLLRWHCIDFF